MRTTLMMVSLVVLGSAAHAQDRSRPAPAWLWVAGSTGMGLAQSCGSSCGTRRKGPTANVRLGTSLGSRLVVGVQAGRWFDSDYSNDVTTIAALTLTLSPLPPPLYLRFTLGRLGFREKVRNPNTGRGSVPMVGLGAGYNLYLGNGVSVAPFFAYYGSTSSTDYVIEYADGPSVTVRRSRNLVQVGLELSASHFSHR